jgi:hypothetical protein
MNSNDRTKLYCLGKPNYLAKRLFNTKILKSTQKLTKGYNAKTVITATLIVAATIVLTGCKSYVSQKPGEPFSVIVLPDTQYYADLRLHKLEQKDFFYSQTNWIKANKKALNIKMVAHVGDIVQTDFPAEWEIADKAFRTLDNSVPYILAIGNHDMGTVMKPQRKHAISRETHLNDYFPTTRFKDNPIYQYGGCFETGKNENSYLLFEAGGMKFLILALELVPRDEILEWANNIVSKYSDRRCIVVTHDYLMPSNELRARLSYPIKGNSGQQVWDKFVSHHKNIFMVLCGHYHGETVLASKGNHGNMVYQVLADYQEEEGGQGYLRIMKFVPAKDEIQVETYSTVLKKHRKTAQSQFILNYSMPAE